MSNGRFTEPQGHLPSQIHLQRQLTLLWVRENREHWNAQECGSVTGAAASSTSLQPGTAASGSGGWDQGSCPATQTALYAGSASVRLFVCLILHIILCKAVAKWHLSALKMFSTHSVKKKVISCLTMDTITSLSLVVLNPRHLPGVPSFVCLFFTLFEARIGWMTGCHPRLYISNWKFSKCVIRNGKSLIRVCQCIAAMSPEQYYSRKSNVAVAKK